ncbi:MAG: hypothetical protein FJZ15_07785, partial [Candidatus Omnitrophica bacterium]|nr:hypothetical protein [Candidatus Omnitrophota bacterium]
AKQKNHKHFLSWVHSTFGPGIARHFMVPYNTKFWTLPLQELSCEWLDGFVPVPSIKEVLRGGNRRFGYNAKFWYPKKGGIKQLPDALARGIKNIVAGCEVTEIDVGKKRIKTSRGDSEAFDYLIYSLPLPEAPGLIKNMPTQIAANFKKLRWNSIFVLNLGLDKVGRQDTHWIYFPGEETCFFRIGFAHNFSPYAAPKGKTSLYAEVAYSKEMPLDKDYAAGQVKKHLSDAGIISKGSKLIAEDKNDISYGYPIYDFSYRLARKKAIGYLEEKGILCCGRYGSWKYMSMEDSILDGKRVAQAAGGLI